MVGSLSPSRDHTVSDNNHTLYNDNHTLSSRPSKFVRQKGLCWDYCSGSDVHQRD